MIWRKRDQLADGQVGTLDVLAASDTWTSEPLRIAKAQRLVVRILNDGGDATALLASAKLYFAWASYLDPTTAFPAAGISLDFVANASAVNDTLGVSASVENLIGVDLTASAARIIALPLGADGRGTIDPLQYFAPTLCWLELVRTADAGQTNLDVQAILLGRALQDDGVTESHHGTKS